MALQKIVALDPTSPFPVLGVTYRRYVGHILWTPYEGFVGRVSFEGTDIVHLHDALDDFSIWFDLTIASFFKKDDNLGILVPTLGSFTIFGVYPQ